jgi:hypothetical protein
MENNGDSILSLYDEPAILATTDFSTKYIKDKRFGRYPIKKEYLLVFSWTDDKFRNIEIKKIKSIKPLSDVLNNTREQLNG